VNKTYLIASGVGLTSLAVGATSGYFLAKRKFDATLDEKIADEVAKTKKYYSVLLMQKDKPDLADLANDHIPSPPTDADLSEEDAEAAAYRENLNTRNRRVETAAKAAQTNYQAYASTVPETPGVVHSNIFTTTPSSKRPMPPRDEHGKFLPKDAVQGVGGVDPYLIGEVEFLQNDMEHNQESALYFAKEDTVIMIADNEPIDVGRIGEENLTDFPQDPPRVIYVRNEGLQLDYQITLAGETLTGYMGLGEEDPEDEEDDEDDENEEEPDHRKARFAEG
jgi:hypothetical protein